MTREATRGMALLLALVAACGAPTPGAEPTPSFVGGERSQSKSRRASDERPQPFEAERGPFQSDRLELAAYVEKRRQEHRELHSTQHLALASFDHPACAGLEAAARRDCPLLAWRWARLKAVEGGIVLEAEGADGALLRRVVLCHIAFGQTRGQDDGCPLHMSRVRVRVEQQGKTVRLVVTTAEPSQVSELRRRVKSLVP